MPEISHKELNDYLKKMDVRTSYSVCLLHGEEMLYKAALNELLKSLLPDSNRYLNCDTIDGSDENIYDVIERMNTYSLLSGPKVITLLDSKVFYSKNETSKLIEKAREAYDKNDLKKAARFFASLLSVLRLTYEEFKKPNVKRNLKIEGPADAQWMDSLNVYCIEQGVSIPKIENVQDALGVAVEKGFPKGNHLIITTDLINRRMPLFKTIMSKGLVIDCSVPKGERREDKLAQEAVLLEQAKKILAQNNKTMNRDAFEAAKEMTGFDLRAFTQNLEKLVDYAGSRKTITLEDIEAVLSRTKKDPIYELTNAIAERDLNRSLHLLDSLLSDDIHPLQILAAVTNQIRKLIMAKGFLESEHGSVWHPGLTYPRFKTAVMPALRMYDKGVVEQIKAWSDALSPTEALESEKNGKRQKKANTDLCIVKSGQNPYPVFLLLKRAYHYSKEELFTALEKLSVADIQLKSTGQNPRFILERSVFDLCSEGWRPSGQLK